MPARPSTTVELLTLESHLLSHVRYRDRMLIIAGTQVGCRITELLTWTVGQILGADGDIVREVTVTRADLKGGKGVRKRIVRSRRVVLNERARGVIRDYIASLGTIPPADQFLFRSRSGDNRPISRTQAHRLLKSLCRECGVDSTRISTHSLRKSFVRAVYDASGHDLVRTQRIVQHALALTTARYLESTQTELDELVLGLGTTVPVPAATRTLAVAS